jgi:hypothetical protein
MPCLGRFNPGKDSVPIVQEAGWAQGWSGWVWKIKLPPGFDPLTVQPVEIRYPGPRLLVLRNPKLLRLEFSPRIGYYVDMLL